MKSIDTLLRKLTFDDLHEWVGGTILNRGNAQVEQSDDEGETAMAIATCMETVMAALPQSSLPSPEVEPTATRRRDGYQQFPDLTTLIDIAILEKRLDDVVELYQRLCTTNRWGLETDKTVAQAVADSHPQVALNIWQSIVEALIGQVKPKAHEEAAIYLRLMEKIYSQNQRLTDWQELLGELRKKHKRKRRLISTLDNLGNRKIID